MALTDGDITKRPYILACVTRDDAEPYLTRLAERRAVDRALLGFLGVELPWEREETVKARRELPMRKEDVVIGGFCGKTCIPECTQAFGEALWLACRTCPD